MMKKFNFSMIFVLVLLVMVGCRKDKFIDDVKPPVNDPTFTMVIDVTGYVTDEDGVGVEDAIVTVGTRTVSTDAQGVFLMRQTTLNSAGSMISVSKDNYFDNYRIVYPHDPKEKVYIELAMTKKQNPTKFQSTNGSTVNVIGGATVQFTANSISLASGAVYSGEVLAYTHWYDPTDIDLARTAPANLEGIDKNGDPVIMYTYGMIAVELYSPSGEELQITAGESATLEMPIPAELQSDAPDQVPLWSIDEATGKWVEEEIALKNGNTYKGEVSHFSFWNVDVSSSFINIEGYLKAPDGTPVANYPVYIKRTNLYGAYGYTNDVGYFEGYVPNDEVLRMIVQHCGVLLIDMEIGPFSADTDLGDFEVELTDFATTLTASLKGCIGEPLPFAYGLTNTYSYISPDSNGDISAIVAGCGTLEPTVKFYDGQNINVSDLIDIDKNATSNALGDIALCTNVGEYITYSVDGGDYNLIENPDAFIVNGNRISLKGSVPSAAISFSMDVETTTTGVFNPTSVQGYSPDGGGPNGAGSLICNDNVDLEFPCDQFTTEILSVDLVEEIITGTFEGYLLSADSVGVSTNTEVYVEGSFRSKITDQFDEATISGKIWVDLNENGTRDVNEEDQTVCGMFFSLVSVTNTPICIGKTWINSEDGTFTFDGLRPDIYYLRTYDTNYELTDFQMGDPAKDNDFSILTGTDNYASYEIDLASGQHADNIDLGFNPPTGVSINMYGQGCIPDITLTYNIQGGLKPYTVDLSNGDSQTDAPMNGTFSVPIGAYYTVTVTDALGNTSTDNFDAPDYTNAVFGYVWEESGDGDPIRFDFDTDEKYDNALINLRNADGSLYESQLSNFPGYQFDNIPYGDYYIEVEMIAGYTMVEKDETHFFGGGINPSTHQSDVFSITECFTNIRRNVGYVLE